MMVLIRVLSYSVLWAVFGVGSGWLANRCPDRLFAGDSAATRIRPFEQDGRWYDRHFHLRAWKSRLPEAGALFKNGVSKASLPGFGPADLEVLARETRRAEWVHLANIGFGCTFVVWQPWNVAVVMAVFGLVVHLPFVLVQRYNRARVLHVLDRWHRRVVRDGMTGTPQLER